MTSIDLIRLTIRRDWRGLAVLLALVPLAAVLACVVPR